MMIPRVASTPGRSRSTNRLAPQDLLKRVSLRRKRDAEKALIKARDCLKILLKAKYPTRRQVEVGDTNSDTALISKCIIFEAPPRRRRGTGENCMPLLRSPLSCCPVTTPETVVMQTSWVLFESPSFDAPETSVGEPIGLICPTDGLNNMTNPPMTESELSEGLSKWWAQLEQCWEIASKTFDPLETSSSNQNMGPPETHYMSQPEAQFLLDQNMSNGELPLDLNMNAVELPLNTSNSDYSLLVDQNMINAEFPLLIEMLRT